jgi:glycosyltransferase involved in cell wall biosynthesis
MSDSAPEALSLTLASANDRAGGAAVAASRLRDGLLAQGHAVRYFVQTQTQTHPATFSAKGGLVRSLNRMRSGIDSLPLRRYGTSPDQFSTSWLPRRWPTLRQAQQGQLLHLHWTNAGFLSVDDIASTIVPVVWTLHDMWALTGGCQYDAGCGRHTLGCGACPVLGSIAAADLSSRRHSRKRRLWRGRPITLISPSQWLAAEARRSPIFEGHRIEVLRNGLDLQRYRPQDRAFARQALGLPADKRLVLFGSINPGSDSRKGYDLLQAAIGHLAAGAGPASALALVVFGSNPERDEQLHGLPAFHKGQMNDDVSLALLYAACDVFVAPSRQDNLPNTVVEALACGLPCVAFGIGGLPDLIEHGRNGYLAKPFEAQDLARGIAWCLDGQGQRWQTLCESARRFASEHLDLAQQTARHVALYRDILETARTQR